MTIADIEILTWILWVVAGLVVAFIAAGLFGGRRLLGYDLLVGVVCSILGGWCSAVIAGDATRSQLIVSVLCAVLLSVLGVYILNRRALRGTRRGPRRPS